jgi:hypothetical protein
VSSWRRAKRRPVGSADTCASVAISRAQTCRPFRSPPHGRVSRALLVDPAIEHDRAVPSRRALRDVWRSVRSATGRLSTSGVAADPVSTTSSPSSATHAQDAPWDGSREAQRCRAALRPLPGRRQVMPAVAGRLGENRVPDTGPRRPPPSLAGKHRLRGFQPGRQGPRHQRRGRHRPFVGRGDAPGSVVGDLRGHGAVPHPAGMGPLPTRGAFPPDLPLRPATG